MAEMCFTHHTASWLLMALLVPGLKSQLGGKRRLSCVSEAVPEQLGLNPRRCIQLSPLPAFPDLQPEPAPHHPRAQPCHVVAANEILPL